MRAKPVLAEVQVSGPPTCAHDVDFPGVYAVQIDPHLHPSLWIEAAMCALKGSGKAAHPEGFEYSASLEARRNCGRPARVMPLLDVARSAAVLFKLCD